MLALHGDNSSNASSFSPDLYNHTARNPQVAAFKGVQKCMYCISCVCSAAYADASAILIITCIPVQIKGYTLDCCIHHVTALRQNVSIHNSKRMQQWRWGKNRCTQPAHNSHAAWLCWRRRISTFRGLQRLQCLASKLQRHWRLEPLPMQSQAPWSLRGGALSTPCSHLSLRCLAVLQAHNE